MEVGEIAPEISLFDTQKTKVSLDDYKGKNVLILFFPLAFSSGCTAELCSVRDELAAFNDLNAQVIGISVDSLYALGKFKELQGINFTLLSDFNKEVSKKFDVLYENFGYEMKGVSKRAAFIIDKDGILRYKEVCKTPAEQPDFEAIKLFLGTLN